MDDFVEKAKEQNPIEDVIHESYPLNRMRGRYLRASQHESLVVDTIKGKFHWNSKGDDWQGDVIRWLEKDKGWDFKTAVEYLCRRAGMPTPNWGAVDEGTLKRSRLLQDVFAVAAAEFHRWLAGDEERGIAADAEALGYCCEVEYVRGDGVRGRGRCWTMETVTEANLGFSGRKSTAQIKSMRGEFSLHGIDPESPQAVAVLSFSGDVSGWGKHHGVQPHTNWVENGRVPGLMDRPRLIYVHEFGGRVRYLSARNLPGYDSFADRETGKTREIKSFNPPVELVGERQPYFNHVYRRDVAEVGILEGQGDAVTMGQMGIPSVATMGVNPDDPAMRGLVKILEKHAKYLGYDADKAGNNNRYKVAALFGPMTRLIEWPNEIDQPETVQAAESEKADA